MPSVVEIGFQSYRDLSLAFSATVFGTPSTITTTTTTMTTAIPICASSAQEIEFFLDPYDTTNDCAGSDWIVVLIMGILIHILSWWGRWLLWEPLAAWRIRSLKTTTTLDPSTKERFGMTMTSILFHTTSAIFVFALLTRTEWLYRPKDWSANILQKTIEPDFKFYYLLYLSRYCSDSISMFFEDRRRDQFLQMMYHHIGKYIHTYIHTTLFLFPYPSLTQCYSTRLYSYLVTIGLIVCSSLAGFTRYGGVIMFFFDWADLPLLSAKACKYLSTSAQDGLQSMANRLFQVFAVVYTLTRSVMYNFVVYTAIRDLPVTQAGHTARFLLLALAALQTFWLKLLFQAIQKQIANGGNVEDIREDSRNDDDGTTATVLRKQQPPIKVE